jgi:hypothetical protein
MVTGLRAQRANGANLIDPKGLVLIPPKGDHVQIKEGEMLGY